ncbi:MAG TPA: tetratricopeptide repeat protein, partial [Kofleriaceae bacterium]|nr:tetratricopeptide repeat protein [Kofleriaceae bacterium]
MVTFRIAHADGRGDVEKKIKEAMEQYDLMDYDAAKKLLNQALQSAKKANLGKDAITAKAYLDLGIVDFVNGDQAGAKEAFATAASIEPKIQIDPAYKTAEMAKLLDASRGSASGAGDAGGGEAGEPAADCASVKGLQHDIIDSAKGGAPLKIEALVGSDVKPVKVSIMYRPEGATDFTEVKMSANGCKYTGSIPASGLKGSLVHYYVAAYNEAGKPIAAKGSQGSPNIIEVTAPTPGSGGPSPSDDEDPISGKKVVASSGGGSSGDSTSSGGEVSSSVT